MKKAKASKRERNTFSIEKTKRYLATMQCDQMKEQKVGTFSPKVA